MSEKIFVIVVASLVIVFGAGYSINKTKKEEVPSSAQTATTPPSTAGKSIDLSGQQLTTIPESILSQTNITSLNLSNNQLTTLPAGIERLTNLEVLNVENNRLESLPSEIGQLKKLKSADFSNNRLMSLPQELGALTQLESLNLDGYKGPSSDTTQLKSKLPNTSIEP